MQTPAIVIRRGELVALRLFDVAYAIDLATAEASWAAGASGDARRSQLTTTPSKAIAFDVPPLLLSMGELDLTIAGSVQRARISARLYDFGVIALAVRIAVSDLDWAEYADRFNALDRAIGPAADCPLWKEQLSVVCRALGPALQRPGPAALCEDYLIGIVQTLDRPLSAAALREHVDLAGLLSGETRPLSEAARRDLLRRSYSYFDDDLVVLTWDRAFIYEPAGDSDVADVIEVANAQLLEFRYYDELLDDELPQMYGRVDAANRAVSLLASRRVARLARKLYTLVAEVTELTEKVDNALQVTEDVYLARVYSAALELFRVPSVSAAVERKLAIVRDTYAALYHEASSRRAELLEIAIVLLIVTEIVMAFWPH